jgi:uncharacterized protein (DUF885 family)
MTRLLPVVALLVLQPALAVAATAAPPPAWVQKSDTNAMVLLKTTGAFHPEDASRLGLEGYDDKSLDLGPQREQRYRRALAAAIATLEQRRSAEKDHAVLQDIDIIIKQARDGIRGSELEDKLLVPYFPLERMVFSGLRALLDDQIDARRRAQAVVRLRRYAGVEPGTTALATLAEARTREKLGNPQLLMPIKSQLEKDLSTADAMVRGIEQLFEKYKLTGWQEPMAQLEKQLAGYDAFLKKEILPKARTDFRQPLELYEFSLEQVGVDVPAKELMAMAHAGFDDIQKQMAALAPKVAAARKLPADSDYRAVLRALKREQLVGPAILAHYQERLKQIEQIIREHHLVTLPERPARIRLASEAESAQTPAPNMRPPRLIGNSGEQGEFVLPLRVPPPPGSKEGAQKLDDFTHASASWALTAHEARPGHELQFDAMVERGVSLARAVYAFNSVNVEGWGLYSEAITLPYMPVEGQLVALQFRLQRAARAFLDPELQLGKISPEQAKKVLMDDVVLSQGMANSEVERYTFRSPGQATAYYFGFTRLQGLRKEVEGKLGKAFDAQKLHDFILAEGLLPPKLLRAAVLAHFAVAP